MPSLSRVNHFYRVLTQGPFSHIFLIDPRTTTIKIEDLRLDQAFPLPSKKYTHKVYVLISLYLTNVTKSDFTMPFIYNVLLLFDIDNVL